MSPLPETPPRGYRYGVLRTTQVVGGTVVVDSGRYETLKQANAARRDVDWRLLPSVIPVANER